MYINDNPENRNPKIILILSWSGEHFRCFDYHLTVANLWEIALKFEMEKTVFKHLVDSCFELNRSLWMFLLQAIKELPHLEDVNSFRRSIWFLCRLLRDTWLSNLSNTFIYYIIILNMRHLTKPGQRESALDKLWHQMTPYKEKTVLRGFF